MLNYNQPVDSSVRSKRTVVTADIHERGEAKRDVGPSPTAKRPLPQYSNTTECKANEDINAVIDSAGITSVDSKAPLLKH